MRLAHALRIRFGDETVKQFQSGSSGTSNRPQRPTSCLRWFRTIRNAQILNQWERNLKRKYLKKSWVKFKVQGVVRHPETPGNPNQASTIVHTPPLSRQTQQRQRESHRSAKQLPNTQSGHNFQTVYLTAPGFLRTPHLALLWTHWDPSQRSATHHRQVTETTSHPRQFKGGGSFAPHQEQRRASPTGGGCHKPSRSSHPITTGSRSATASAPAKGGHSVPAQPPAWSGEPSFNCVIVLLAFPTTQAVSKPCNPFPHLSSSLFLPDTTPTTPSNNQCPTQETRAQQHEISGNSTCNSQDWAALTSLDPDHQVQPLREHSTSRPPPEGQPRRSKTNNSETP